MLHQLRSTQQRHHSVPGGRAQEEIGLHVCQGILWGAAVAAGQLAHSPQAVDSLRLLHQPPACLLLASAFFLGGQLLQTPTTSAPRRPYSIPFCFLRLCTAVPGILKSDRGCGIQRISGALCRGRRKDRHGRACLFLPPLCGNMETYSVNCVLARQINVRNWQKISLSFSWAAGTKIDGFCHIDVLVCGPASVSEKAEGEKLLF